MPYVQVPKDLTKVKTKVAMNLTDVYKRQDKAVTEPTCTEMGYTVFTCKDCGDTYTGDYTDAKGHSYKEEVIAPTCTEMGYSIFTCEVCGHSYRGNETDKTEHSYSEVMTDPTCTCLLYTSRCV